ncbi:hypothetical protein [Streptomyces sp. CC208A]|uniref:hypothetical protein n=1 Tax=Streptomyces sp. CC208A TaxID=3044573 RepID=UPI0024A91A94|nr:hypothetical protein [Streptomyces sp. CC208A]
MPARRTQTNEAGRCVTLLPLPASLPQPLALIEVAPRQGCACTRTSTGTGGTTALPSVRPGPGPDTGIEHRARDARCAARRVPAPGLLTACRAVRPPRRGVPSASPGRRSVVVPCGGRRGR